LKLLRRILVTLVIAIAVVFAAVEWVAPVALSFYAAKKAPAVTRVVPADLKDQSISQALGAKLSYFGYEFEIPWSDLDETHTKLYPKDKPEKCKADLQFRSGLHLLVTATPPREWVNGLPEELEASPQELESAFGTEAMNSDYNFLKTLYAFTPDAMHHWTLSSAVHAREGLLLIVKSLGTVKAADTGIFNVRNENYKGFQQGDPRIRQDGIAVELFSDEGNIEFVFFQKNYKSPTGLTQPEINRIVQSLHRTRKSIATAP